MSKFGKKGYKAFDHGMVCRGKQYAENTVFEEQGAKDCCEAGMMHYCENPLDVLNYYPLIDDDMRLVEIAEVEPQAEVLRKDDKCATKKLKIGAKLSLKDYIKASIEFVYEKCKSDASSGYYAKLAASGDSAKLAASGYSAQLAASGDSAKLAASGDSAKLAASGYYAQLAASGYYAQLAASGDYAKLAASGDSVQLAASGYSAQLAASGDYAKLAASGDYAKLAASCDSVQLAASGDYAKLAASGDSAKLAASGDSAKLAASGKNSVAAAIGENSIAKGALGNWLVLAEWVWVNDDYTPVCVKAVQVDGEKIKADTWYTLKNGEFVEV